jgi:hypothetical protein
MPPINATVYWDDNENKGTVDTIKVPAANGATVIQWTCGTGVASFAISGLDATEFGSNGSNGNQVTNYTATDRNNNTTVYNYTVDATHEDGRTSSHDPKIENGTT